MTTPNLDATPLAFPDWMGAHFSQFLLLYKEHKAPYSGDLDTTERALVAYILRRQRNPRATLHNHPPLVAKLTAPDPKGLPMGWLAAALWRHSSEAKQTFFDLHDPRQRAAYLVQLGLSVAQSLRLPEEWVCDATRAAIHEPVDDNPLLTSGLLHLNRFAPIGDKNLKDSKEFVSFLLAVMSLIAENRCPNYVLAPQHHDFLQMEIYPTGDESKPLTGLHAAVLMAHDLYEAQTLAHPEAAEYVVRHLEATLLPVLKLPPPYGPQAEEDPPPQGVDNDITVIGPAAHASGLGAAVRVCVDALIETGRDVRILKSVQFNGRNDESRLDHLNVSRSHAPVNVIHFNPDVIAEHVLNIGPEHFADRYNIGYCVWETTKATPAHQIGLDLFDEIWVPTRYCHDIFAPHTRRPVRIVRTPLPAVNVPEWMTRRHFGLPEDTFLYVFTFEGASHFTRKNPLAVIKAFRDAFPAERTDVGLVIKTHNTRNLNAIDQRLFKEVRTLCNADKRIILINESFRSKEAHALINLCDCYVSLHRSEGMGYGMAEALLLGRPVIATNHSGNTDFITSETGYPVDFKLIDVKPGEYFYPDAGQWADPDHDHAGALMRHVLANPDEARGKVAMGQRLLASEWSTKAVAAEYRKSLDPIFSRKAAVARAPHDLRMF